MLEIFSTVVPSNPTAFTNSTGRRKLSGISMRNVEFRTSSAVAVPTRGASERKPSAPSTGSLHVPF